MLQLRPEDKDEEKKENEEHCDVVHGTQHDDELVAQRRHEANQLQYAQQSECTQYRQTTGAALQQFHQAAHTHTHTERHRLAWWP